MNNIRYNLLLRALHEKRNERRELLKKDIMNGKKESEGLRRKSKW